MLRLQDMSELRYYVHTSALLLACAMAGLEFQKQFKHEPLKAALNTALKGTCYAVGAEFVCELLPLPISTLVPLALANWCLHKIFA